MRSIITIICALIIVLTTPDEAGAQNFIIEYSGGEAFTVLDTDNLKLTGRIKLVNEGDKALYIDSTAIPVYVYDAQARVTHTGIYTKYADGRDA